MDGGAYRAPRQTEKSPSPWKPEDKQSKQSELNKPVEQPVAPSRIVTKDEPPKKRSRLGLFIIIALVIVILVTGWFVWSKANSNAQTGIDSSKYQAVFFTNGQVYFGKLEAFNQDSLKMTDIYYLQTQSTDETDSQNPQQTATDQNDVQLIKLGEEIHGPEDEMILSKEQVLFYENLKPDGKVTKSIQQYKSAN